MSTHDSLGAPGGKAHQHPKQLQDALQAQAQWSRSTLASIGDAVITADSEGRVTFLNPVAESLTGWTSKDATGQPLDSVFRIINEESRQPVENPALRALSDGVVVGLANHSLLVVKDGQELPIDDSAAPIRNENGEVIGVVLVFRDVSDRRRAEQQTHHALVYADSIIATLREPFVVLDGSLHVRTANACFYRTFQVSKEETEGRLIFELGRRQWDIPPLRTLLKEVLSKNHSFHDFDVELDFPTIGRKSMLLNARRVESQNGLPDLILLAIEDATGRKEAALALETSEVRYRRLFETAQDGILILDAGSGKIIDANPFMTDLLGYSRDEFMDKELWQIGLFADKAENEALFRELQEHGYVRYEHLPLQTQSGVQAEVEFVSNVYNVERRHVAQCNIRDISDRSRLERQTQDQAAELLDLHRRKDEFLAMLSHELRSPLAPIMNAVQLLQLQHLTESPIQQRARTIIARQVHHLKDLVDDLLEVARITTGRVRLRLETVAVGGVVEGALETVRPLLDQRKHELTLSLPPEPIWLHADAARLEQVVVNLLTNAVKYTDEGGRISLTVQQEGDACVLRVKDSGIGIERELLPRIFDLFTQADRLLDRSQGGLGIGLSLVKQLTALHGGTVEAFSTVGEGSEFVVRLPLAPLTSLATLAPIVKTGRRATERFRVLVVDDNVDTAESFGMLVNAAGYDVRTVHDGPTAVQVAREYKPNAVLLDIGLPGFDGYEVAKQLRQITELQDVLIIAVTGYGRETDRERSEAEGFDYHMVKPPDYGKLREILAGAAQKASR
jgi:PAS domain S-box-containing protein